MNDHVSVIIAVYNGERFLAEAIESALGQTRPPEQVVVVDDGSADHSGEIAAGYEVTLIRLTHSGVGAARNAGLAAATGSLLTFLDSDDVMLPRKLEVQVAYLAQHPEVGAVLVEQEVFVEPGVVPPSWVEGFAGTGPRGGLHPLSLMLRRHAADVTGPFRTDLKMSEDMDFIFRMRAAGVRIDRVPEVLVRRRIHGANMTYDEPGAHAGLLTAIRDRVRARDKGAHPEHG